MSFCLIRSKKVIGFLLAVAATWLLFLMPSPLLSQENCVGYRLVPQVVYDRTPVTVNRWVNETVNEKQKITTYKPVWKTEKREIRNTVLKPVQKTTYKEEQYIVSRPVKETKYREQLVEETTYEKVTETRDQEVIVEVPVYETEMREQKVVVQRPVNETVFTTENVTTYRPAIVEGTQLVQSNLEISQLVMSPSSGRPRARWLSPGYYTDPVTGLTVYRNRGFHWIQQPVAQLQTTNVPVLTAQPVEQVTLVPEIVQTQKPVEVTRFVETVETRKVPVLVEKTQRRVDVRKVPVTFDRPKTVVRKESIPYETTRYVDEVRVRKVPVTETTYEPVEEVTPRETRRLDWVAVTEEIEIPQVRRKLVKVEMIKHTPRTVMMKVPIDALGNIIGPAQPMDTETTTAAELAPEFSTPASQIPPDVIIDDPESGSNGAIEETSSKPISVLDNGDGAKTESTQPVTQHHATPVLRQPDNELSETSASSPKPRTELKPVAPRSAQTPVVDPDRNSGGLLEGDLPRATKPTRSPDSLDVNPADQVPSLDSRPSSSTPPDTNGSDDSQTPDTTEET